MKFSKFKGGKTLSMASLLSLQNPNLAAELKKNEFLYISCFEDKILGGENLIRCEIGSISYVLALICKYFLDQSSLNDDVREYLTELDEGLLSGESSVGEEEFEAIAEFLKDTKNIIIDSTFFTHLDSKLIFEFLNLLNLDVVLSDGEVKEVETGGELSELKELESFDGSVIFAYKGDSRELVGSASFAIAAKIKDGDMVNIKTTGLEAIRKFRLDSLMKGTVGLFADKEISGYNFKVVKISKID
ncbi:hypothetical protein [Campylobacter sp.]|uniref:hypothetical protein n=1 Tax=Campylobacter sp. TaxID=205 RepID=UPI0026FC42FC|nr:hypothetical protein [Campylobacter sp.]